MKRLAYAILLALLAATTALGQDRFIDAGDVRIRYVDRGAGPPVVLVHGFTASIETSWIDTGVLPDRKASAATARRRRLRARAAPS
jgi:pimeloyl-ACP methyl ester carboxylesterase